MKTGTNMMEHNLATVVQLDVHNCCRAGIRFSRIHQEKLLNVYGRQQDNRNVHGTTVGDGEKTNIIIR